VKKKHLVSERIVRDAARTGRPLDVWDDLLVTPAARDLARELGVALRRETRIPFSPDALKNDGTRVRIALGSDHGGYQLKESLRKALSELDCAVTDVGCTSQQPVDYPVYARKVARLVAEGESAFGVMVDGAGIGSAMVANKVPGVRAAMCYDLTTAKNAREHINANMLTLGGGLIGPRLAAEIVRMFLTTPFAGGRHQPRVAMIDALDHH
jgi:ribose 5-phosphate isomerase B